MLTRIDFIQLKFAISSFRITEAHRAREHVFGGGHKRSITRSIYSTDCVWLVTNCFLHSKPKNYVSTSSLASS